MLVFWAVDFRVDADPISHGADLPKRYARLGHAPGTRVHAEQQHPGTVGIHSPNVLFVGTPGVDQRIVNMSYRRAKAESVDFFAELAGGGEGRLDCGHDSE